MAVTRVDRIYLAARYSRYPEMRGIRSVLRSLGFTVTSRWIEAPAGKYGVGSFNREQLREDSEYCSVVAVRDVNDIRACDTLIHFCEEDGGGKGGRHVELGIAIGMNKKIIVVGPRENIFHTYPGIEWYPDWERLYVDLYREHTSNIKAKSERNA